MPAKPAKAEAPKCPKCADAMEEGFHLGAGRIEGSRRVATWMKGRLPSSLAPGIETAGRKELRVSTWRCRGCGFLESWAR